MINRTTRTHDMNYGFSDYPCTEWNQPDGNEVEPYEDVRPFEADHPPPVIHSPENTAPGN